MMAPSLSLSPRYRLDDESMWLQGIDPARNYWLTVNGDLSKENRVAIPGLRVTSGSEFKQFIRKLRALEPGERMQLVRADRSAIIYCVSANCYAIEIANTSAPVWHLFDQETLESLLMTAHPDWQCDPKHIDLGRQMLMRSLSQPLVA